MNQLPGPVRPFIVIQPLPRQKRRAWWPWVITLAVILALLFAPLVKSHYYKSDQTFRRSLAAVLVDWADANIYINDWTDWK